VPPIISIRQLSKTFASGVVALDRIDLDIARGEIFALLGPNGAGKTTLIGIVCGIVKPTSGSVLADGHDVVTDYRAAREKIGLVPQELSTDAFETVWATVNFSRGLFGKASNPAFIEQLLRDLSLWDKRKAKIMTLSGGMKRRVLIAKALSHEPQILFLDEPTAGVDVELRRDMWEMVRTLRDRGVTVILTTHYIEEAEQMADRIGVINHGRLMLVEDKTALSQPREGAEMNVHAIRAIFRFEMARTFRTIGQSLVAPVLTTSLYFIVFGAAIGPRMGEVDGVDYGAFIVPGLIMLSLLNESISNASFGIYLPKWSGTIYELLSAPVSFVEVVLGYVGAAATKSLMIGTMILVTARCFVPYEILHPFWMLLFLVLTAVTFSMFGFLIGLWADSFQKLQVIPLMVMTPLTFLGGAFYSINMLPPFWQTVSLFNPVVYLISGMRWSFYGVSDVNVGVSAAMIGVFLSACLIAVWAIFRTGYKLRN
jgi:ABC-2 type transport system permease protein